MITVKCQKCSFEHSFQIEDLIKTKEKCKRCQEPLDIKSGEVAVGTVKYPESATKEEQYYYIEGQSPSPSK